MRRIVCEDCRKAYDYDRDEFCPHCGAFNQPVKTWGTDAQGNIIRVDGLNESGHAGSFAHHEVHREKGIRRAAGMDWNGGKRPARRPPTPRQAAKPSPQPKQNVPAALKTFFWLILILVLINFLFPLLAALSF